MPLFLLRSLDGPDAAAIRAKCRDAHVAYIRGAGRTRIAGPILDEAGGIAGSLLIFEAADLADAQQFVASEPYQHAQMYSSVEVYPFDLTYIAPTGEPR